MESVTGRPLIYIAGPITDDPWGCVGRATTVASRLNEQGFATYLPQLSVLHEMVDPQPYEYWIEQGLEMVSRSDAVIRLTGKSPGADAEMEYARILDIPTLDWYEDLNDPSRFRRVQNAWLNIVMQSYRDRVQGISK